MQRCGHHVSDASHARRPDPVGILAGWGDYPLLLARRLRTRGRVVVGLGLRDHADPELARCCDHFYWIGIGSFGRAVRLLARHGVREALLAGKLRKVEFFRPGVWWRHRPDGKFLLRFGALLFSRTRDRKDDTLLGAVVSAFAREGVTIVPPTDLVPELLAPVGLWTRRAPTRYQQQDILFGWELAREMGRLDVGQTVVVKGRATLCVEAIEGTDACIARAGELCPSGGFTVVKVAKPQQDMRFDVPTVGRHTIRRLIQAGAGCLAIEAGRTIFLDRDEVVQLADRHGLVIVSLERPEQLFEHLPRRQAA